MKNIVIYHANCLDGFASAWVMHYAIVRASAKNSFQFVAAEYGQSPPDVTGCEVYILDFSYPRDVLIEMAKTAEGILVLDHHKSAREQLVDLPENVIARFDMEHSGCILTWRHFFGTEEPPDVLAAIEDRDLWRFELDYTKEVCTALFSYEMDFNLWDNLMVSFDHLAEQGETLLRQHDKTVKQLCGPSMVHEIQIAGHRVPCVNAPWMFASDLGHELCHGHKFAAIYWMEAESVKFSLRSDETGIDVSDIAKVYGGGGHKNAAGFRVQSLSDLT